MQAHLPSAAEPAVLQMSASSPSELGSCALCASRPCISTGDCLLLKRPCMTQLIPSELAGRRLRLQQQLWQPSALPEPSALVALVLALTGGYTKPDCLLAMQRRAENQRHRLVQPGSHHLRGADTASWAPVAPHVPAEQPPAAVLEYLARQRPGLSAVLSDILLGAPTGLLTQVSARPVLAGSTTVSIHVLKTGSGPAAKQFPYICSRGHACSAITQLLCRVSGQQVSSQVRC